MEQITKGEIPFVRILFPLISGISTAYIFLPTQGILNLTFSFLCMLLMLLIYIIIFYKKHFNYRYRWLIGLLVNFIIFFAAYDLTLLKSQKFNTRHLSRSVHEMMVVTISSEPRLSSGMLRFESQVTQGYNQHRFYPLEGRLLTTMRTNSIQQYRYGDMLLIPASYTEITGPLNPAEFNYKAYLADHGIYHQVFIEPGAVRLLDRNKGNPLVRHAFELRQKLVRKFNKYLADRNAASVASTLILGYRAELEQEVLNAYSKTGTMHVLSVSGMHVGIVFLVMVFMLKFMDRSKKLRLIRAVIIISLIWFYAIITGFSPAACRAALMLSFVVIGKAIRRSQNTYNLMAISAVLLLLYDPFFLFDVGFQLSYLAIFGLVYLYPKIYRLIYIRNKAADLIWSCTSVSIAAQLATFPLSMYYFHQFPVYFLISNLFIILPVTVSMYAGLLFLFIPWDLALKPLGWLLEKSILFTNYGLFYIENMPFANISGIWINAGVFLLIYILMLAIIFSLLYRKKYWIYAGLALSLVLVSLISVQKLRLYKQKQVVFYSLRQNTAIGFLEGGKGIVLTDLDPDGKPFGYSVAPSLDSMAAINMKFITPGKASSVPNFFSDGHFIQFRDWKLLVWNKDFDRKTFSEKIIVEAVLLQGNPSTTIKSLMQWVRFNRLIIDGSNTDYRIKNWQQQAKDNGVDCYVLKNNPAYIIKI